MSALKINLILLSLLLFQCTEKYAEEEHGHEEKGHAHHEEEENETVELNAVQLTSAALQYGTIDTLNISGFVKANGTLDLPPQNIAAVSAPMSGFVRKANYLVGDYVKKGTVLAVLEHLDYVKLQEEYLNVLSNITYLEADYQRQRQLDSAEVSSRKQLEAATASFKSAQARKLALEKQLRYLGLSPQSVAQGNISSTISIRAPLTGYITQLNVHNGEFAKPEQELYELVDPDHMHLEINVFEQDIKAIEIGQPIRFKVPALGREVYLGEVFLVGKSFDENSNTVKVHGHLQEDHQEFIRGLYVEAKIYTAHERVPVLPVDAVIVDGEQSYIFVKIDDHGHDHEEEQTHAGKHQEEEAHGTTFKKLPVVTGKKDQGYIEIKKLPALPDHAQIVTHGAYHLFAEMKKGEGGHHHH